MPHLHLLLMAGGLLLAALAAVSADEIELHDGRVLEGVLLTAPTADPVDIRIRSGRIEAIMHIKQRDIKAIRQGQSDRQRKLAEFERDIARIRALPDDEAVGPLWQMAEQLQTTGERQRAREIAELVIERDRHHQAARQLLGYQLHQGVWMRPHEALTAEGRIQVGAEWLTWDEQQQRLADSAARRQAVATRLEVAERQPRSSSVENFQPIVLPTSQRLYCPSVLRYHLTPTHYTPRPGRLCSPRYRPWGLDFRFGGSNWALNGSLGP